jgi:hypothetical protein
MGVGALSGVTHGCVGVSKMSARFVGRGQEESGGFSFEKLRIG